MRILILLFVIGHCKAYSQNLEIESKLSEFPNVVYKSINTPEDYSAAYELRIKQPLDHSNPEAGYFYQRAYLSHKGFSAPTVMVSEGYSQSQNKISELSSLLNANQLVLEHRYYGQSKPEGSNYEFLNMEQCAADLHNANKIFKQIYSGKWLCTGISKGGQTSIYYRYFYPKDVDASVPYVAPFNLSLEDKRVYTFLDSIGSSSCRNKIRDMQIRLLQNREEAIKYLRWYSFGAAIDFTRISLEEAFEYAVLQYPFSFWQWGYNCGEIPDTTATVEHLLVHLLTVSNIDFFSDHNMEKYESHYYQAATELGYYGYNISNFKNYLKVLSKDKNPSAVFPPNRVNPEYDSVLAEKVFVWLQSNGDKFIYINGAMDSWSATAIPENLERDALWFFMEGKNHENARIRNMTNAELGRFSTAIKEWLDITIKPDQK